MDLAARIVIDELRVRIDLLEQQVGKMQDDINEMWRNK